MIAIGLQTIAIGIDRIFLNADTSAAAILQEFSYGALKSSGVKMVDIVLSILFLEGDFKLRRG